MNELKNTSTLFYFAYGSNLLGKRLLLNNRQAIRAGIGYLKDYRLDFGHKSTRWGGESATIVPHSGRKVWGALWHMPTDHLASLDDQEGVSSGIYKAVEVEIHTPDNGTLNARSYQLCHLPEQEGVGKPSRVYLEVILHGAVESGLPKEYVEHLQTIPHNGFEGPIEVKGLDLPFLWTKATSKTKKS